MKEETVGRKALLRLALVALALAMLLMGCSPSAVPVPIPGPGSGGEGGGGEPTGLTYGGPAEFGVKRGEALPGTDVVYLGQGPQGAEVSIGGQKAIKQKGDSLDWSGEIRPGVHLELNLRVLWFNADTLHCGGVFKLRLDDWNPVPGSIPTEGGIKYRAVATYWVDKDEPIPGTTIRYAGSSENGAVLEGIEGYPYRKIADSIVWTGSLRDGVYLRLNVRVLHFDESSLKVAGSAEIIIK